jgi:pimeloyl-ACP methyl ester carboxylesterase
MAVHGHLTRIAFLAAIMAAGCAVPPFNPSFPIATADAKHLLEEMEKDRKPLARPLVILGGYLDPGLGSWWVGRRLRRVVADERILEVEFFFASTFDECRAKLIDAVEAAFPSANLDWTTTVDVVGISMGGLVARLAALPAGGGASSGQRLRIARLFTISTPHRGAALAELPSLHPLHLDMRPGSDFLQHLNEARRDYEIIPYARLGDGIVGVENTAPPGETAWWLPGGPLAPAHIASATDLRIHADIARRLRGEEPLARSPPKGLPEE